MRTDLYATMSDEQLDREINWYYSILHGGFGQHGLLHSLETGNYTNSGLPQQVSVFQSHLKRLEEEAEKRFLLRS